MERVSFFIGLNIYVQKYLSNIISIYCNCVAMHAFISVDNFGIFTVFYLTVYDLFKMFGQIYILKITLKVELLKSLKCYFNFLKTYTFF